MAAFSLVGGCGQSCCNAAQCNSLHCTTIASSVFSRAVSPLSRAAGLHRRCQSSCSQLPGNPLAHVQIDKSPEVTDFAALTKTLVNKAKSSDDITRYSAIRWLNCFLHAPSSHDSMLAFLADLIVAVLPCISHSATNVRDAAIACNHRLLTMDLSKHLATVGIGPVLTSLSYELVSQQEPTRLEALKWVQVLPLGPHTAMQPSRGGRDLVCMCGCGSAFAEMVLYLRCAMPTASIDLVSGSTRASLVQVLLEHNKAEVLQQWHDIMPALLDALTATSDGVVNQVRRDARVTLAATTINGAPTRHRTWPPYACHLEPAPFSPTPIVATR